MNSNYKYIVGEIVNGLEILQQIRINYRYRNNKLTSDKGYKYKCLKDGYIGYKAETSFTKGIGCPVCSNKIVVKGINDISTTNPEMTKYLTNIDDSFNYAHSSNIKVLCRCPTCKFEKEVQLGTIYNKGFPCPKCSDGISYPNKFMFNILEQLNLDFEKEKQFIWSQNKRYDFYISKYNCIIEMYGLQHYSEEFIRIKSKNRIPKSLRQEKSNDIFKEYLSIDNGIENYIKIDSRYSTPQYIKKEIMNSNLNSVIDLSNINWDLCHKFSVSSRVKEACDLWNNTVKNVKEISEIMKLHGDTVRKYLKQGVELNWSDYNAKEEMRKSAFNTQQQRKQNRLSYINKK